METWLRSRPWWQIVLVIVLAGAAAFGVAVRNGFVSLDDGLLIYANPAVAELSARSVWHIFTSYDPELYVPLTLLSFQIEHALFGFMPMIFHISSLFLHLGSAVLVFAVCTMLTGRRTVGLLAALLFAVHPLNVEAVAWAAARKDVLSGFFCLAAVACHLRWKENKGATWRWPCTVCFALGLMAKVSIISLPLLLVAIEWSRGNSLRKATVEQWPQWLLAGLFGIVAVAGKAHNLEATGPLTTVLLACKSTAFYLLKLVLPTGLSAIYPQTAPSIASPDIIASVAVVIALLGAWVWLARISRELALGLAWFLLALPPNFLNFYKNHALYFGSDRYAYVAAIGIFLLFSMLADWLLETRRTRGARLACTGVLAALIVALGGLSAAQIMTWRDNETLYTHVTSLYPDSWVAWNNLGQAEAERGDDAKAETAFLRAQALAPSMPLVLVNLGNVAKRAGDAEAAAGYYRRAAATQSGRLVTDAGDLVGYYYLGELEEARGNMDAALAAFQDAAKAAPGLFEPQENLALQYQKRGMHAQAAETFAKAVALRDDAVDARYRLASELAALGRLPEALTQLEAVDRLQPGYENTEEHIANIRRLLSSGPGA